MFVASFLWMGAAASDKAIERTWGPLGGLLLLAGATTLVVSWFGAVRRGHLGRKEDLAGSSLVIGPDGLAMIQGRLRGELAWDEVLDIALARRGGRPSDGIGPGLVLLVEGAAIPIADLYDRPIAMIHERLLCYWKPERLGPAIDSSDPGRRFPPPQRTPGKRPIPPLEGLTDRNFSGRKGGPGWPGQLVVRAAEPREVRPWPAGTAAAHPGLLSLRDPDDKSSGPPGGIGERRRPLLR